MNFAATLIAAPQSAALSEEIARTGAAVLPGAVQINWLADASACDLLFAADEADTSGCRDLLREALGGAPLDIAVQPATGRRKQLLVADMDSTIIGQECIDELGDALGIKERIAAITERAMRGEIDFENALIERVGLLRGLDRATLQTVLEERITLNPGAATLVATMKAHGARTALISGGFSIFTTAIAERAGFDDQRGNELLFDGDRLSGDVARPILGQDAKRATLREFRDSAGLAPEQTLAVGDGANDLAMLEEAGLGVAFHAKPAVAAAVDVRIDHGDLTALLYLQGYHGTEFSRRGDPSPQR